MLQSPSTLVVHCRGSLSKPRGSLSAFSTVLVLVGGSCLSCGVSFTNWPFSGGGSCDDPCAFSRASSTFCLTLALILSYVVGVNGGCCGGTSVRGVVGSLGGCCGGTSVRVVVGLDGCSTGGPALVGGASLDICSVGGAAAVGGGSSCSVGGPNVVVVRPSAVGALGGNSGTPGVAVALSSDVRLVSSGRSVVVPSSVATA